MKNFVEILVASDLFSSVDVNSLEKNISFAACVLANYHKGSVVIQEGEACTSVGIVVEGTLALQQLTANGESMLVNMFNTGESFAAALVYQSDARYPFTLVALKNSKVLYVPFSELKFFLQADANYNKKFIEFLSDRMINFKSKLQMLQNKDVRSRLMHYLAEQYKKTGKPSFLLPHKKSEIAELIGVARPSVPRELKNMEQENILKIHGKNITLLKPHIFE